MQEVAAIVASMILMGLAVFQIALIFGAPLGEFAWGGQHKVLPKKLRIASVSSIALYIIFAIIILSQVGIISTFQSTFGIWAVTIYMFLGIGMNAISRSKKERAAMTPLVTVLAICSLIVAVN
jgi:hypothetical protein